MNRKFPPALAALLMVSLACRGSARATPTIVPGVHTAPTATIEPVESFIDPTESQPLPPDLTSLADGVERDVTYCTLDGVELKMDVYFPKNASGATALTIFIHGGGWSEGDKADGQGPHEIPALVEAGFTVASLNYRLAPAYKFPAMIEDVKCALRSFRAHAGEYNIDPNRIGVWGASAGGHLVNLLGLTDPSAGFDRGEYLDQSSRVQAVVDMFGPADLTTEFSRGFSKLSESVFGDFDRIKASPITYISPDDPPFLILQGDMDLVVPLSQSQQLYEALIAGGVQAELVVVTNGNHGFSNPDITPTREEITAMIVLFFEEHLK